MMSLPERLPHFIRIQDPAAIAHKILLHFVTAFPAQRSISNQSPDLFHVSSRQSRTEPGFHPEKNAPAELPGQ
jgi:hypothetical protein